MTTQAGREMLIKLDLTGDGQFETIAGLRSTRFALSSDTVDSTAMDSPDGWRELLGQSGLRSAEVKGAGVFRDSDTVVVDDDEVISTDTPDTTGSDDPLDAVDDGTVLSETIVDYDEEEDPASEIPTDPAP